MHYTKIIGGVRYCAGCFGPPKKAIGKYIIINEFDLCGLCSLDSKLRWIKPPKLLILYSGFPSTTEEIVEELKSW